MLLARISARKRFLFRLLLYVTAIIAIGGMYQALARSTKATVDWAAYNGGGDGDHYSPLTQIDRGNVARLRPAWTYDTGEKGSIQTNPLIVGRVLYGYTPKQKLFALDAATGRKLWSFDSGVPGSQPNRGMAYWSERGEKRLLAGVMNFVYALDPVTGKPIPSFGEGGRIDLRKNLGDDEHYQQLMAVLTTPGIIYKDLLIVGFRAPEEAPAPHGDIRAFDVRTGALRWSFHTIPHPGEFGYETWPAGAWKTAGAANNWSGMALDQKRGIVYVPTGCPVSDFYGADRVGDGLFGDTLLALDARTGKRLWHFQGVHHDVWDRDFPAPPALVTVHKDGRTIDALAQTSKQGFVYLFDRVTGKPLFPIEEKAYPASDVPGERAAVRQALPVLPLPFTRQILTEAMITERTPEAHAQAVQAFRHFRSDGQFVPLTTGKQTIVFPGFDGGAEWGGPAVDVKTGVLYVNANDVPWTGGLIANKAGGAPGEQVYLNSCASCHGDERRGSPPAFPSLVGVSARMTEAGITATIQNGRGRMPSFPNLGSDSLQALLAYLKTSPEQTSPEAVRAHRSAASAAKETVADTKGEAIYGSNCAICHGEHREGNGDAFPSLMGVSSRRSPAQVLDLVQNGRGRMPAFAHRLSPDDREHLFRFLGVSDGDVASSKKELENSIGPARAAYRFTGYRKFQDVDGYPAVVPPWGTLTAIDLNTGQYLWQIPFGEYPELAAKGMKNTGTENYGGPVVTAGGVLFIGATNFDDKIHAYDSSNGRLLWEYKLPFAGNATPAVYMIDGREYVVIAAAGGRNPKEPAGGEYVAFALP